MCKRILLMMCTVIMMAMPVCSAENWVHVKTCEGYGFYIDMDSAWYDGTQGGYLFKWELPDNYTAIENEKFKDYGYNELVKRGTMSIYDAQGNEIDTSYSGAEKVFSEGQGGWDFCQIVKHHCGY